MVRGSFLERVSNPHKHASLFDNQIDSLFFFFFLMCREFLECTGAYYMSFYVYILFLAHTLWTFLMISIENLFFFFIQNTPNFLKEWYSWGFRESGYRVLGVVQFWVFKGNNTTTIFSIREVIPLTLDSYCGD